MRIVITGCGPKALAVYAKLRGLEQSAAGFKLPEIVILEQYDVAANWRGGNYGFTDGDHPLGTPPEKDIGYPYDSEYKQYGATDIDSYLFQYSWPSYKIARGSYADWTDRARPAPHHSEWAQYLAWVGDQLRIKEPGTYLNGVLRKVSKKDNRWLVDYASEDLPNAETSTIECDALVFTGPGEPKRLTKQTLNCPVIFDGRTFWMEDSITLLKGWEKQPRKIAVIGAGETAAAVICALLKINTAENWNIEVISRRGTLYSRGEGYHENRYFSNPRDWGKLPMRLREELIERTDRGVLSLSAVRTITASNTVDCWHGHVISISWNGKKAKITLVENELKPKEFKTEEYDCVIVALGFDPLSFCDYFKDNLTDLTPLLGEVGADRQSDSKDKLRVCAQNISEDLSVTGLEPKLYLPMLAGLMQGPGFPNLSCLGLLSDRILRHSLVTLNPEKVMR